MTDRTIKLSSYSDIESLKRFILDTLNLFDHKKNSVTEFDDRLKSYINRNKSIRIVLLLDWNKLETDLKFRLSSTQPFPVNYEMGNPHNRWIFDPIVKTEEEIAKEKNESEKEFEDKLTTLKEFLNKLELLGNGQICTMNS